ncbi:hypothetical protein F503_08867 [Ophiostoma piceae UAMH 11346]|uniref:Uncharacterized protein n=1 Tax=Ophiostoma piceae (strain UAMH 11346) TaxID=1262450 RepID=S3CQR5_OPHP1|nr:hypothetical protein F503_08867 [Ophiostoma piceae UAMH 11346]
MECDDMPLLDANSFERKHDDGHLHGSALALAISSQHIIPPSPIMKTRSLSDGGSSTPGRSGRLSPTPFFLSGGVGSGAGPARSGSKDDSSISSPDSSPIHLSSNNGGTNGGSGAIGAMNIPGRKSGDYGGATESSTSLWSMMGRSHDSNGKAVAANGSTAGYYPSSSMGSANTNHHLGGAACSDSSSSSGDDDFMDEDTDEPFITTPQVGKTVSTGMNSPAMNSLLSFTHRQRPRKQSKRLVKGPLGLGFSSISATSMGGAGPSSSATAAGGVGASLSNHSKSPPSGSGFLLGRDAQQSHSRRESISWAANQLHISGSESDDNPKTQMDVGDSLGQRGVIRRQVTRRGNLLPKTKGFARIRAALAEESAPGDADFRRESEVVRQVLESDMDPVELLNHQTRLPPPATISATLTGSAALNSAAASANANITAIASPRLLDNMDDIPDDDMAVDAMSGFGKPRLTAAAGTNRLFWNKASAAQPASGSLARAGATTPPPPHRTYSLSSMADDTTMDSPGGSGSGNGSVAGGLVFPSGSIFPMTTNSSSGGCTPQPGQAASSAGQSQAGSQTQSQPVGPGSGNNGLPSGQLPSAAEITRRINSKRRRDDDSDLDPMSFKRRAVSPSISVHNSPIMQSPLQRDVLSWGGGGGTYSSNEQIE